MTGPVPRDVDAKKLTIIGAGIVGICSGLEAIKAGYQVTIVDRLPPGAATSHGNAGVVSPWSVVPQALPGLWKSVPKWFLDPHGPVKVRWRDLPTTLPWVAAFFRHANAKEATRISNAMAYLVRENQEIYAGLLGEAGRPDLIRSSDMITVSRSPRRPDLQDIGSRLRQRHGAKLEVLTGDELREIEPFLSKEIRFGVATKNQSRCMDPGEICKVLARHFENQSGVILHQNVKAIVPKENGGFVLQCEGSELFAQRLLLAAGAWSSKLLRPLGINLPLIGERGYHLIFKDPQVTVNNSISDGDAKIILSEMTTGVRIAGTAEFADPDAAPNYARAKALQPLAKRLLPGLNTEPQVEWMGVRPSYPDNLPTIGPLGKFNGLFGAFGHSHYGFGMAPQTARLAVKLITGQSPNEDLSSVSFSRYGE